MRLRRGAKAHDRSSGPSFCAEPQRAAASWPRAVGADRVRHGAPPRRPLPRAHRGYRRGPLPRGVRRRHLRGSRLARASPGRSRCCASRSTSPTTWTRRSGSRRRGCSTRALPRAARSRRRRCPVRVDPDGAPLYPGLHKGMPRAEIDGAPAQRRAVCAAPRHGSGRVGLARERLGGEPLTFTELDESGRPQVSKADAEQWGDAVILRKDVPASYHLAVVVDDARQGITHVTRGRDLFQATGLHRLLQVLLGLPRAALPASSAAGRCRGPQARQECRRHGAGGATRRRCIARRRAPHGRPGTRLVEKIQSNRLFCAGHGCSAAADLVSRRLTSAFRVWLALR